MHPVYNFWIKHQQPKFSPCINSSRSYEQHFMNNLQFHKWTHSQCCKDVVKRFLRKWIVNDFIHNDYLNMLYVKSLKIYFIFKICDLLF